MDQETDAIQTISRWKRIFADNPVLGSIIVGTVVFSSGAALGYFLGRRRANEAKVDQRVKELADQMVDALDLDVGKAIKDVRPDLKVVNTPKPPPRYEKVEDGTYVHVPESYDGPPLVPDKPEGIDDWDYEKEMAARTPDAPYAIHKDEFYAEEMGYAQNTLTYYAGDEIVTNEDDTPIYNWKTVIGNLRFGHGSGDLDVFYVRNDVRQNEYEVVFEQSFFSKEILGLHEDPEYGKLLDKENEELQNPKPERRTPNHRIRE